MRWVGLFVVLCVLVGALGLGVPVARAVTYYVSTAVPTEWYAKKSEHGFRARVNSFTAYSLGGGSATVGPSPVTFSSCAHADLEEDNWVIAIDNVPDSWFGDGLSHTFTWHYYYDHSPWNIYEWTSSLTVTIPADGVDTWGAGGIVNELEVALTGPNLVVPSLGFLYTATISGGVGPYAVQFSKMKSGGTSYWYYDAVNTSSTVVQQYISFDQVGTYTARVVVIDGESTSVQDTMTVTVEERKPDLWGVVLIEGGELQFALSGAEGGAKPEWGYGVYYPTSVYTVKAPSWRARESDHYTLDLDAPYPNPLVVVVRYTDPSTGSAWDYEFTFDMTDVDEEDEWIDSNGVGEVSLVDTLPEWLKAVLDGIRDVFEKLFRWLFVPTSEQVSDLLPSGSLGASLLDGVAWTGAEAGEYTLHGHWTVNGSEVEVPLVSFNVSSVAASPFVGVVRKIVQAGVCLALVYMVVVLV